MVGMLGLDQQSLADRLWTFIPLILSLSVHECARLGRLRLGDPTAKEQGRLTLNPLAHVDPVGTVLLPLLGVPFGWAKPVPINPMRFRRVSPRTGMMFTAVAGPLSNLLLAFGCTVALALLIHFHRGGVHVDERVVRLLSTLAFLNVILAVFNLLPIPPLDGSRVVDALVPAWLRPMWEGLYRLGPLALIAVIVLPQIAGFDLFVWPWHLWLKLLRQLVLWLG